MHKTTHEIRDPVHGFIRIDDQERDVLDSPAVQRLRNIHQLATTCLVYPGASHKRFEHSLGVMELATRVFDVVTAEPIHPDIREGVAELADRDGLRYWRRVLRMAALCHDIGHLPFSHAADHELLPDGWDHERLTVEVVKSTEMESIWKRMTPPLRSEDIAKLAVGQEKLPTVGFSAWEALMAELIVGDSFGADRMDYLLRDSHHAGVAYGKFDHFRLVDTLRILPWQMEGGQGAPYLGIETGGLHSAEALLLARYFMFTQVYFHPVRLAYDVHLADFLKEWLPNGKYPTSMEDHLKLTDAEVTAALAEAARDVTHPGSAAARCILERNHLRVLWELTPADLAVNPGAGQVIHLAAAERFEEQAVRRLFRAESGAFPDFPVLLRDGSVVPAQAVSTVLRTLPRADYDYVFVKPELLEEATSWLKQEREAILQQPVQKED